MDIIQREKQQDEIVFKTIKFVLEDDDDFCRNNDETKMKVNNPSKNYNGEYFFGNNGVDDGGNHLIDYKTSIREMNSSRKNYLPIKSETIVLPPPPPPQSQHHQEQQQQQRQQQSIKSSMFNVVESTSSSTSVTSIDDDIPNRYSQLLPNNVNPFLYKTWSTSDCLNDKLINDNNKNSIGLSSPSINLRQIYEIALKQQMKELQNNLQQNYSRVMAAAATVVKAAAAAGTVPSASSSSSSSSFIPSHHQISNVTKSFVPQFNRYNGNNYGNQQYTEMGNSRRMMMPINKPINQQYYVKSSLTAQSTAVSSPLTTNNGSYPSVTNYIQTSPLLIQNNNNNHNNNFNYNTNIINNRTMENQFCNFCKKNGESVDFYTSHKLSIRGITICPVLLRTNCTNCGRQGHTIGNCSRQTSSNIIKLMKRIHSMNVQ